MRVVANNPELNGQDAHQAEIDPATWRNVRLRMEKPDGGELLVTLLRSAEWLESHNAALGNTIRLTFVELGIDGPADVLAVEACPTIESGNGRVVTGTFRHSAANVIDLYVTSDDQPIGTTANHPFWSETRQDFVQAGTLQPGEELRTATGATAHVRQLIPRPRSAEVFNLEVDAEHCYAVGRNGLVVHNSNNYNNGLPNGASNSVNISDRNLQKVFGKHRGDFGLSGNWNPSRATEVRQAITSHLDSQSVQRIAGTYRGQKVIHVLDPSTGLNVILDEAGDFIGGWQLGADQLMSVLNGGRLF